MPSRGGAKRATGCSDVTDQDPPAKRGKAAAVASVPVAAAPQRVLRRGAAPAPAKTMTAAPAKSARAGRDKAPAKAPTKVTKTSAVAPQPRGTAAARGRGRSTRKVEVPAPEELDEDDAGSEESDDQEESENESSCDEDDATTAHGQFMQLLQAREEELGKHCVVLQQAEADEDEVTLEELRGLARVYVPPEVQDAFIEVWSELDGVEEGSESGEELPEVAAFMRAFLGKCLGPSHALKMHAILGEQLAAVDRALRAKSWRQAFCCWLATTLAARREPHWWEDTDKPKAAESIFKRLAQQWSKISARSDEELGGLVSEGGADAKGLLAGYLDGLAEEMRTLDYKV